MPRPFPTRSLVYSLRTALRSLTLTKGVVGSRRLPKTEPQVKVPLPLTIDSG